MVKLSSFHFFPGTVFFGFFSVPYGRYLKRIHKIFQGIVFTMSNVYVHFSGISFPVRYLVVNFHSICCLHYKINRFFFNCSGTNHSILAQIVRDGVFGFFSVPYGFIHWGRYQCQETPSPDVYNRMSFHSSQ